MAEHLSRSLYRRMEKLEEVMARVEDRSQKNRDTLKTLVVRVNEILTHSNMGEWMKIREEDV